MALVKPASPAEPCPVPTGVKRLFAGMTASGK